MEMEKSTVVPSTGKFMETIFWDARGIFVIDYLNKEKTINSEYYEN